MQANMFPEVQLHPELELDERYTLRPTLELCRQLSEVASFDLDVAACDESHCANEWFCKRDDGLVQRWFGHVWCNPPFTNVRAWVAKAWSAMGREDGAETVSMLLPATRTEQPWWQDLVEPFRDDRAVRYGAQLLTHFLPGRIPFGFPGNPKGVGVGSPPFGCVLLVWKRLP